MLLLEGVQYFPEGYPFFSSTSILVWDFACLSAEISIQLFSFPFYILLILGFLLFLVGGVISLSYLFFMWCSCQFIDSLFDASESSSFFSLFLCHPPYVSHYASRLFFVLSSISWSSYLIHFKNDPEYLTKETTQVFIFLTRFLLYILDSNSFHILLRYSFFEFFLSSPRVLSYPLPISLNTNKFFSFQAFWFFLYLLVLFLPSFVVFLLSLFVSQIFLCTIPSLYPECIFSLPVFGFLVNCGFW